VAVIQRKETKNPVKRGKSQKKTRCTGRKRGDYSLGEGIKHARDTVEHTIRRKQRDNQQRKTSKSGLHVKKKRKKELKHGPVTAQLRQK
jgi:hypothetical protein